MDGWIKLHRSIRDNPVLRRQPLRRYVFEELLLKATTKPYRVERRGYEIMLQPGQVCVSIRSLAKDLKVGHQVMRRVFDLFENRHMIQTKTSTLGTIVTICNWEKFQADEDHGNTAATQQATQQQHSSNTHYKKRKNLDSELNPTSEPSLETPSPMINNAQLALGDAPEKPIDSESLFEEWWQLWALPGAKRGKGRAKRKYQPILKRGEATANELTDGVKRYMVHCHRNDIPIQFIQHPATWLHGQGWKDELIDDQPDRRNGNGKLDPERLARELADELGGPDGMAVKAPGLGPGDTQHPHGQEGPSDGRQDDGLGLPEVPTWFDQDGD